MPIDLDAIRERYRVATEDALNWDDTNQERDADRSSMHDVPDLLAEVDRLREQIENARTTVNDLQAFGRLMRWDADQLLDDMRNEP